MPSRTVNVAGKFPDGTEIKAYPVSNWPAHQQDSPSGAPVGAASDTETVSGAAVTFTLDAGRYWVTDATGTRYLSLYVGQDQAVGQGASHADLTAHEADTTAVHGITNTLAIPDGNLASPNNSVYRSLLKSATRLTTAAAAGTKYIVVPALADTSSIQTNSAGAASAFIETLAAADLAVAGKTTKLRVRGTVINGTTSAGVTVTLGLYPIALAANVITLGTLVTGSDIAAVLNAANTFFPAVGADFTIPADDRYALGATVSGTPLSSNIAIQATLQVRHV